jgi:nitroimidazol reductase NimA-like FMN-containing flavoprotein (pyridoxamine 5'-phosphate oxidase superfamily)
MPGYGVPDDVDGVLPWSWAEERLVRNKNYWLVTASAEARPHALPVWGIWRVEPAAFVFSCAPDARKVRNLKANPQASVAVDDTVECVSVEGRARLLTDSIEQAAAIEAYLAKYYPAEQHDAMADFLRQNVIWVVEPERAFAVIEREAEFGPRATKWTW